VGKTALLGMAASIKGIEEIIEMLLAAGGGMSLFEVSVLLAGTSPAHQRMFFVPRECGRGDPAEVGSPLDDEGAAVANLEPA